MGGAQASSRFLLAIVLIAPIVFLGLYGGGGFTWAVEAQGTGDAAATSAANNTNTGAASAAGTTTNVTAAAPAATSTETAVANETATSPANITATNTTAVAGDITSNITTVTVVSYITLPPVTRPPTNIEIAKWLSGGVIAGILVGLSIGYAVFAGGVSIKRQQPSGKGVKAGEKAEKRKR